MDKNVYKIFYLNRKALINTLFFLYIIAVINVTFIVRETMVLRTPENRGVILQPFREFEAMMNGAHFFWFKQIFLNILLFVSFGVLLPMVSRRLKKSNNNCGCRMPFFRNNRNHAIHHGQRSD